MRALVPILLLAAPALAESDPAVEAVLGTALEEQRLLAGCLGMMRDVSDTRAQAWSEAVAETVAALEEGGYDPEATGRFRDAAAAVDPLPDASYAEVRDVCWTRAKELDDLYARWSASFSVTTRPGALPAPFGPSNE